MSLFVRPLRPRPLLVEAVILVALATSAVAMPGTPASAGKEASLRLVSLSAHPDLVSANDVLVEAEVPRDQPLSEVRLTLNGTDVTGSFRTDANTHTLSSYSEDHANGDIHMIVHQFSTRARLAAANGDADNQVMLVEDDRFGGFSLTSPVLRDALTSMDQWLSTIVNDHSTATGHRKVVQDKPTGLTDACWSRDAAHRKIVQPLSPDNRGECGQLFPVNPTPRLVAGAALTDDVVTCHRKPIDWTDYHVSFTAAERRQLQDVFTSGVCDWTKPGVGQQPLRGTWLTFN